ncbi:ABC transporter substrate-binding protein [Paenibacillus daejeonensis]|uniref:ABC transporter substrate-binding protein n=1 Tax=Paenibacillus daejeonensis TaxID=135193 RepID=UPI0003619BFF|nr:sugar ABC transporter substrate-binding protein [Paenibacillus daejeonensis]
MKKRYSTTAVLLLSSSLVLAACGNNSNPGTNGGETGQSSGDKVEVRLATWAGNEEANELQAIIDELNANSTTYTLVQDSNPAEYDTRIITQLSGNSGPDLFWISAQRAAQFSAQGAMLDITDRLEASDHPAAQMDDYYEASLQPFTHEGQQFGLPWLQQPIMMYVNKGLFDEAELSYPDENWTWEDFSAAMTALTKDGNGNNPGDDGFNASNTVQWGFTLNGWPPIQMFVWQNGGEVLTEDGESPIDSPEATEAMQFYAELLNGPLTPSQSLIRDRGFDTMFRNGQVAMFMGGAADDLDSTVENVEAFMVPAGPDGTHATFADVLGMGINSKTNNPDAAFDALVDLTDAIHHWKIMPPRVSLGDLETLQEMHPQKAQSLEAIIASMEYARPYLYSEQYPNWDNVFTTQLIDPMVNSGADPLDLIPQVKPLLENAMQ